MSRRRPASRARIASPRVERARLGPARRDTSSAHTASRRRPGETPTTSAASGRTRVGRGRRDRRSPLSRVRAARARRPARTSSRSARPDPCSDTSRGCDRGPTDPPGRPRTAVEDRPRESAPSWRSTFRLRMDSIRRRAHTRARQTRTDPRESRPVRCESVPGPCTRAFRARLLPRSCMWESSCPFAQRQNRAP